MVSRIFISWLMLPNDQSRRPNEELRGVEDDHVLEAWLGEPDEDAAGVKELKQRLQISGWNADRLGNSFGFLDAHKGSAFGAGGSH